MTISGGQFDFSSRFLAGTFIPNLWEKVEILLSVNIYDVSKGHVNAMRGERSHPGDIDQMVALLYGVPQLVES